MEGKSSKKVILSSLVAVMLSLPGTYAFASNEIKNPDVTSQQKVSKVQKSEDVQKLEKYVRLAEDGTLYLDESYKEDKEVSKKVAKGISEWMGVLNEDIKAGKLKVTSDFNIEKVDVVSGIASNEVDTEFYWWGFGLYMGHQATQDWVYYLFGTAGVSKATNFIIKKIGIDSGTSTYTKQLELLSDIAAWGLASGSYMLNKADTGNGVLITITYPAIFDIESL